MTITDQVFLVTSMIRKDVEQERTNKHRNGCRQREEHDALVAGLVDLRDRSDQRTLAQGVDDAGDRGEGRAGHGGHRQHQQHDENSQYQRCTATAFAHPYTAPPTTNELEQEKGGSHDRADRHPPLPGGRCRRGEVWSAASGAAGSTNCLVRTALAIRALNKGRRRQAPSDRVVCMPQFP
ncbi:MAG TPA: hypothetical protein VFV13_12990 [Acidimicrobiia bacterium]|nr:hypothetical protein [Acidimicrobiia bacterium]